MVRCLWTAEDGAGRRLLREGRKEGRKEGERAGSFEAILRGSLPKKQREISMVGELYTRGGMLKTLLFQIGHF